MLKRNSLKGGILCKKPSKWQQKVTRFLFLFCRQRDFKEKNIHGKNYGFLKTFLLNQTTDIFAHFCKLLDFLGLLTLN